MVNCDPRRWHRPLPHAISSSIFRLAFAPNPSDEWSGADQPRVKELTMNTETTPTTEMTERATSKPKRAVNKAKTAKAAAKATAKIKRSSRAKRKSASTPAGDTKKAILLALLSRKEGATLAEIAKATDWQNHTIRRFISGTLTKKMGLSVWVAQERHRREDLRDRLKYNCAIKKAALQRRAAFVFSLSGLATTWDLAILPPQPKDCRFPGTVAVVLPRSGCGPRCVPRRSVLDLIGEFKGVLTSGQGKPTKPSCPWSNWNSV